MFEVKLGHTSKHVSAATKYAGLVLLCSYPVMNLVPAYVLNFTDSQTPHYVGLCISILLGILTAAVFQKRAKAIPLSYSAVLFLIVYLLALAFCYAVILFVKNASGRGLMEWRLTMLELFNIYLVHDLRYTFLTNLLVVFLSKQWIACRANSALKRATDSR